MANTSIQVKKSATSGNVPATLNYGELALNYADGKLYYKNASGVITYISGASINSFSTINVSSSLILATSNTDTLTILGNNGVAAIACTTTKTITFDGSSVYNQANAAYNAQNITASFANSAYALANSVASNPIDNVARAIANSKTYTFEQNTAPATANSSDLWVNIDTGVLYQNFGNAANPVWAETGPTNIVANTQPGVVTGTSVYDNGIELLSYANVIYVQANSAFNKANGALANTSGVTTAGDLNISGNTNIKQLYSTYNGANGGATLMLTGTGTQGGSNYFDFIRANNTTGSSVGMSFRLDNTGTLQLINSAYTTQAFAVTQTGVVFVGGGSASSTNNDATTNYINFNNQNSVIYDDGNFHIHSRTSGQSMWINTNGGDLRLISQSPVNGGANGTSVIIGGAQSATASGFLNVLNSKNMTYSGYGYLSSSGAGTISGSSGSVPVAIYTPYRIYSGEVDSTSDERLKDIKGVIPTDIALQFVNNINGIHYTWKQGFGDDGLKSGFGAQSVHKAGFAHMVSGIPNERVEGKVDEDGWVHPDKEQLNISYNEAIPYHHEVIKYLLKKIDNLEKTIEELKSS